MDKREEIAKDYYEFDYVRYNFSMASVGKPEFTWEKASEGARQFCFKRIDQILAGVTELAEKYTDSLTIEGLIEVLKSQSKATRNMPPMEEVCPECEGRGFTGMDLVAGENTLKPIICPTCKGEGWYIPEWVDCPVCGGSGRGKPYYAEPDGAEGACPNPNCINGKVRRV